MNARPAKVRTNATLRRHPLKSSWCFAVLDDRAEVHAGGREGVFFHDTRHLSEYHWEFGTMEMVAEANEPNWMFRHWGLYEGRSQVLSVARTFTIAPDGFVDELQISNESNAERSIALTLTADADFRDIFEVRGRKRETIGRSEVTKDGSTFRYLTQDGETCETEVQITGFTPRKNLDLGPGEKRCILVRGVFKSSRYGEQTTAQCAPWTAAARRLRQTRSAAEQRAFDDIDMMMASSPHGPVVLTGVPYYVNVFGRDSLITSWFLLPVAPGIAEGTLRILAAHQGKGNDPLTHEAPGKIAHELRDSELARTGDVPFGRYYGTADASALFVLLMRDLWRQTSQTALVGELADAWRGAIGWCRRARGSDGLLRFSTEQRGRGLKNNSWKDSEDSMSYSDGRLAQGRLAVVEVQGYLAAALEAAAELEEVLDGNLDHIRVLRQEAAELCDLIDSAFWNEAQGIHAMALDEDGRQCDVVSSNPGHLLWSGSLSDARARAVADRLMQPDMWTGWGVRCLSKTEARYQPQSYHNGSVWPHDNGMIAAGAQTYGLLETSEKIWRGMTDAAEVMRDNRLPELFGGYDRVAGYPPIPYAETCSPQAWAAAALVFGAVRKST